MTPKAKWYFIQKKNKTISDFVWVNEDNVITSTLLPVSALDIQHMLILVRPVIFHLNENLHHQLATKQHM